MSLTEQRLPSKLPPRRLRAELIKFPCIRAGIINRHITICSKFIYNLGVKKDLLALDTSNYKFPRNIKKKTALKRSESSKGWVWIKQIHI